MSAALLIKSYRDVAPEALHGVHYDLPIETYHGGPGVSKSGLDDVAASPALYFARHIDPDRPPEEPHGIEGSLAHCAILEPAEFMKRYRMGPDVSRATKVWKEFAERLEPGVIGLKPEQAFAAMRQAASVRRLPEVAEILSKGDPEVSAFWTDEATGELCRCRPDWVHPVGSDSVILADVKTFSSASPGEFRRQVPRMRYHVQDPFYSDGFALASGKTVLAFIFVVVETSWPHLAGALMLDDEAREVGRRLYRRDLDTYAECRRTGEWPGYSDRIERITLPAWALNED